jgi:hypothetical protein
MSYRGVAVHIHNIESGTIVTCDKFSALFSQAEGRNYATVFPLRTNSMLPIAMSFNVHQVVVVCKEMESSISKENVLQMLIKTKSKPCVFELDIYPDECSEAEFEGLLEEIDAWVDTQV